MKIFAIAFFFMLTAILPHQTLASKIQPGLWKMKLQIDAKGEKHEEMDILITDAMAGRYQVVASSQVGGDQVVGLISNQNRLTLLMASKEAPNGFKYIYYGVLKEDKKRISLSGTDYEKDKKTSKPSIQPNHATGEIGYLELMDK